MNGSSDRRVSHSTADRLSRTAAAAIKAPPLSRSASSNLVRPGSSGGDSLAYGETESFGAWITRRKQQRLEDVHDAFSKDVDRLEDADDLYDEDSALLDPAQPADLEGNTDEAALRDDESRRAYVWHHQHAGAPESMQSSIHLSPTDENVRSAVAGRSYDIREKAPAPATVTIGTEEAAGDEANEDDRMSESSMDSFDYEREEWRQMLTTVLQSEILNTEKNRISKTHDEIPDVSDPDMLKTYFGPKLFMGVRACMRGRDTAQEERYLVEARKLVEHISRNVLEFRLEPGITRDDAQDAVRRVRTHFVVSGPNFVFHTRRDQTRAADSGASGLGTIALSVR